MKPFPPAVLAIVCILAFAAICGCTSTPGGTSSEAGIQEITYPAADARTDLSTALDYLDALVGDGMENLTGMDVLMVSGTDLNETANAGTWILGVRQDNRTSLLVYARGSWSRIAWNGTLPGKSISFDEIVMPGDLYRLNAAAIEPFGPETDLLLENGTYTIRSHGDLSGSVTFDAKTGEVG